MNFAGQSQRDLFILKASSGKSSFWLLHHKHSFCKSLCFGRLWRHFRLEGGASDSRYWRLTVLTLALGDTHTTMDEQTNQRLTRSFCLSGGESEETGSRTSHFSVTGWTSTADKGSRIFTRTSSFPPVAFRPSITYEHSWHFFSNVCLGVCACVYMCLQYSPPQSLSLHSVFPDLPVSAEQLPQLCRTWKDLWKKTKQNLQKLNRREEQHQSWTSGLSFQLTPCGWFQTWHLWTGQRVWRHGGCG